MRREGMAQHMRREPIRIDAGFDRETLQQLMATPPRQMRVGASRRKKITRRRNAKLPPRQEMIAHRKIGFERLARGDSARGQALSTAFAAHMDEAFLVAHGSKRQADKLADAQA